MKTILEIACFNEESALIAQKAGANRVEFCIDVSSGGVTPTVEQTKILIPKLTIPCFVMIRPRSGNFTFTNEEYEHYRTMIPKFKKIGVHGFVFGILNDENEIHINRNSELVRLASPLPCTFHRAFDLTSNLLKSLADVINCGFSRILTSGGKGNAIDNLEMLSSLVKQAQNKIIILPGGGIRSNNIKNVLNTGAHEFHSAAITTSESGTANEIEIRNLLNILEN